MMNPTCDTTDAVLLLDDLPLRRAGMAILLGRWAATEGLTILPCGRDLNIHVAGKIRLILLTNCLFGDERTSSDFIETLHHTFPDAPIAILADEDGGVAFRVACALGVQGYITTNLEPAVALKALSFVLAGGQCFPPASPWDERYTPESVNGGHARIIGGPLTARQLEIREALQQGDSNKVIARKLNISEATVKLHVRHIMRKLGVNNRTQVALSAYSRAEIA